MKACWIDACKWRVFGHSMASALGDEFGIRQGMARPLMRGLDGVQVQDKIHRGLSSPQGHVQWHFF